MSNQNATKGTRYCIYRIVATVVTSGNDSTRSHYRTVCYAATVLPTSRATTCTCTRYCIYRIVATVVTSGNDSIRSHYRTVSYATTVLPTSRATTCTSTGTVPGTVLYLPYCSYCFRTTVQYAMLLQYYLLVELLPVPVPGTVSTVL
jgi:hypothetical protein